jgi:hypothetical protein
MLHARSLKIRIRYKLTNRRVCFFYVDFSNNALAASKYILPTILFASLLLTRRFLNANAAILYEL